jgi:hypothetical protein
MALMRRVLREPLVHFLALGALVFAIFHLAADRSESREGRIVVTAGKIEQLATGFSRTWRRAPTRRELDGLVEDHVREEVFYREALALGLDKDDSIVRRRMQQKLEFMAGDAGALASPTDRDLQAWLDRHPEKFRVEPGVAFSQIYFRPGRQGENAQAAASRTLAQLDRREAHSGPAQLGDATALPREMPLSSEDEIGRVFGDDFARQVARLEPGRWSGPVPSGYGWHLVRVGERSEGGLKPLAEVREAAQREWLAARNKELVDSTYAKLRGKYSIVIEGTEP